jgi:hypothetical protein
MNERWSFVPRESLRHFKGISKITADLLPELRPSHVHERPARQLLGHERALNCNTLPWRLGELVAHGWRDKVTEIWRQK